MPPSNLFNFLLVVTLLFICERAVADDDSPGFHGDERNALLALKTGLNNSFLNTNWTGIMCYMNNTPYWYGVRCLNGRVNGLILENMGLDGEIKVDALSNLTELETLSFKNNTINGTMMDFTYNQKLRDVDLSDNMFSNNISLSLINLSSLISLQLQFNYLSGPIPLFNQSGLKTLNVSYNNLAGKIPDTKTLQSLDPSSYLGNENLCGPPTPNPCNIRNEVSADTQSSSPNSSKSSSHNEHFAAILVVADVVVLVVILFLFIIYYKKYKKVKAAMVTKNVVPKDDENDSTIVERASEKRLTEGERGKLVFMEDSGTPQFDLDDLLRATAEGLGNGSFGNCYKAILEAGQAVVVKRLKDLKPLNKEEFVRQVKAIADQKHPNLLPLLAYYYAKDEKMLLYKFASNRNLYSHIHGGRGTLTRIPFRWSSRLAVARSVARAMKYLHINTRSQSTVPLGNLKSTNVLIDENDEILVTDYGLTSLIALPIVAQRMTAYKCPEYASQKKISKKSDIWSLGCLLLEILTGRIPSNAAPPGTDGVDLCSWVHRAVREEWTAEIFDPEIAIQRGANDGMLRLMQIAMKCCDKSPEKRPEINQVAAEIEEIKCPVDSEDEDYSYTSYDRSLTDESLI